MIDPKHFDVIKNTAAGGQYFSTQSEGRIWTPNDGSLAASQSLRGHQKFAEHVNEIFPIPEFNSYLSKPTKKKNRRKLNKANSAMRHFRSGTVEQPKSAFNSNQGIMGNIAGNNQFSASMNLPGSKDTPDDQMKSTMTSFGTKSMTRARTQYSQHRIGKTSDFEQERREIEEIQESMKALDAFDKKYGSVKSKVGYPRVALKSDLKVIN